MQMNMGRAVSVAKYAEGIRTLENKRIKYG